MDKEEHKKLENWVQRISWRLSFALSLGRVILECYRDSNVKESDIEGLIIVMNVCLKLVNSKLNHLEQYLMHITEEL